MSVYEQIGKFFQPNSRIFIELRSKSGRICIFFQFTCLYKLKKNKQKPKCRVITQGDLKLCRDNGTSR